jgi:hypothetical protein
MYSLPFAWNPLDRLRNLHSLAFHRSLIRLINFPTKQAEPPILRL